jgi:hypothetical protein
MNIFNPASLFYFSVCLRLDDRDAEAYHSILETLTRENANEEELLSAIKNILNCDAPFQVYSLPYVLDKTNNLDKYHPNVRQVLNDFSKTFIYIFNEHNQHAVSELFNEIVDSPRLNKIPLKLTQLADAIFSGKDGSFVDDLELPYIDTVEFAQESITLTLINHFCEDQETLNYIIDYHEDAPGSGFGQLMENAYSHKKGRVNFILGVELKRKMGGIGSPEQFADHLFRNSRISSAPDLEPDLVFLLMEHLLIHFDKKTNSGDKLNNILTELGGFNLYHKYLIYFDIEKRAEAYVRGSYKKYLEILFGKELNINTNAGERLNISANIWIGSIYLLINEYFDEKISHDLLLKLWKPIQMNDDGIAFDTGNGFLNEKLSPIINSKAGGRSTNRIKNNLNILSPWLALNTATYPKVYFEIESFSHWLRILYAVKVSKSQLIRFPLLHNTLHAYFLIHVSDLLFDQKWLLQIEISQPSEKNSHGNRLRQTYLKKPQIRKLLLLLNRDVNVLIGRGNIVPISHGYFFDFLIDDYERNWFDYFHKETFHKILFWWIYYGSQSTAIDKKLIEERANYARLGEKVKIINRGKLKVLRKYLFNEEIINIEDGYDEQCKILLTNPTEFNDIDDKNHENNNTLLSGKIQHCLFYLVTGDESGIIYFDNLATFIKSVRNNKEISYLNRFALTSFFDYFEKIDARTQHVFKLSIELIYDLGGLLDISLLGNKIIDKLAQNNEYTFNDAQIDVLNCFSSCISTSLNYNIHERNDNDKPLDPIKNLAQNRKISYLREALNAVQFIVCRHRNQLRGRVKVRPTMSKNDSGFKMYSTDVSVKKEVPNFFLPTGYIKAQTQELSLVTYNSVDQKAQFYVREIAIPEDTVNLFELTSVQITEVFARSKQAFFVIGRCAEAKSTTQNVKYVFQIKQEGFETVFSQQRNIKVGDWVRLKFFFSHNNQWHFIDPEEVGLIANVINSDISVTIQHLEDIKTASLPLRLWLPSHADIFSGHVQSQIGNKGLKLLLGKEKKPQFDYLSRLLLNLKDINEKVVLTFIDTEWDSDRQEYGYLFYEKFGSYYLIFEGEISRPVDDGGTFLDYILDEAENEDDDVSSLNGLLITFWLYFYDSKIRLALYLPPREAEPVLPERFPMLQMPFDKRNIEWRMLFSDSDEAELTAKNINGKWVYELDPRWIALGFKKDIKVVLDRQVNHQQDLDFLLKSGWGLDEGRFRLFISGTVIERTAISNTQLQNYLKLTEGERIQLKTPLQFSKTSASFPCFTKQNFRVTVNLEELTFIPVHQEAPNINQILFQSNLHISVITPWREVKAKNGAAAELSIGNFPPDRLKHEKTISGYFVDIPKKKDQGIGSCFVILETDGQLMDEKLEISVNNLAEADIQRNLSVYSKFTGSYVQGQWHFYLLSRQIYVKSVRKLIKLEDVDINDYYFIGDTSISGERYFLFENFEEPGVIFYSFDCPEVFVKNGLYNGINEIALAWRAVALSGWAYRAGSFKGEMLLAGNIENRLNLQLSQFFVLKSIKYNFKEVQQKEYYIKRSFILGIGESRQQKTKLPQIQPLEKENERRRADFENCLNSQAELLGSLDKNQGLITISPLSKLRWVPDNGGWACKVLLAPDDDKRYESIVFVPSAISNYNLRDVSFWLFKTEKPNLYATFKLGFQTIDDLFIKYDSNLNDVIDIGDKKLYLCNKEDIHPYTKEAHEVPMYRFEQGFGKNILIPASRLLYDGKPIGTSGLIFYHGDSIKKFCFIKGPDDDQDIVLNILLIEISQAHRLYRQASIHRIYHLAYIGYLNGAIYVKYVKGLDERAIQKNSMVFHYERIHASFDELSFATLKERFENEPEVTERVVLVKVNVSLFETTGELQFIHHKLTFTADARAPTVPVIDSPARIIATLGAINITRSKNDYFIAVNPFDLLDKADVGPDFSDGLLLRREFSLNESLLREYYRRGDLAYFDGFEALVTVAKKTNKNQVLYSLKNNPVFREQNVLYGMRNVIGISRFNSSTTGTLEIEVKPGNFLKLASEKLRFVYISDIQEGDILSISIVENNCFQIESAIAGDHRFLENKRKVVVLPKDSVFASNIAGGKKNNQQYTIGGLPNIDRDLLTLDVYERNIFLTGHHPKIAAIFKNIGRGQQDVFLNTNTYDESSTFGYIEIDEANKGLKFISTEFAKKLELKLNWTAVSFYDGSANEIIERIKRCRWQYHDENTVNLVERGGEFLATEPYTIAPSSASSFNASKFVKGPVFCERNGDKVNLRSFKNTLAFWAFPVSSLIDFLDYVRESYAFAYVGKKDSMHFAEVAPGRIVELPVNLLVVKVNTIEISMKDYAWDFLRVGDLITLRNITADLSDLYKIELVSIRHGFRNVLGKYNKFPINSINEKVGLIEIGKDSCSLRVPVSVAGCDMDIQRPTEFYNDGNRILPQTKDLTLESGDTVLMSLDNKGYFSIVGFESSMVDFFDFSNRDTVKKLIKAAGGTIPAIVLREEGKRQVQFTLPSFMHLADALNGKIVSCIIIGPLGRHFNEVVLKVGGFFEVIEFDEIVSGVPTAHREFVIDALAKKQIFVSVWFDKGKTSYKLVSGLLNDSTAEEIFVSKIVDVLDNEKLFIGTLCKANNSQKYYWLPMKEMAWCDIGADIADFVFYSSIKNISAPKFIQIKVRVCSGPDGSYVSKIKTAELYNSFKKKRCGSDNIEALIVTEPRNINEQAFEFIGYSIIHKVLINCILFGNTPLPYLYDTVKTEVIEKDLADLKIKTLLGSRKILVYLPLNNNNSTLLAQGALETNISEISGFDDLGLLTNLKKITQVYNEVRVNGYRGISLASGFIVLERLLRLQHLNRPIVEYSTIAELFEVLKLNLLRQIYVEAINNEKPDWLQDHYLDFVLADLLKPFYENVDVYLSEQELSKLSKLANTLCFQLQDSRYPIIGNSILQALGQRSYLDKNTIQKSKLFEAYSIITADSQIDARNRFEDRGFISKLRKVIEILNVNHLKLSFLNEKIGSRDRG